MSNQFIIVNPKARTISAARFPSLLDAQAMAGLGNVDHGSLVRGLGYVVDEFGLFVPPMKQSYFGIGSHLIAGTAVFYGYDEAGETIDLRRSAFPDVRWFLGVNDVEASIDHGDTVRPIMAANGVVLWQWPNPPPEGMGHGQ
jgi:hypothetical protein